MSQLDERIDCMRPTVRVLHTRYTTFDPHFFDLQINLWIYSVTNVLDWNRIRVDRQNNRSNVISVQSIRNGISITAAIKLVNVNVCAMILWKLLCALEFHYEIEISFYFRWYCRWSMVEWLLPKRETISLSNEWIHEWCRTRVWLSLFYSNLSFCLLFRWFESFWLGTCRFFSLSFESRTAHKTIHTHTQQMGNITKISHNMRGFFLCFALKEVIHLLYWLKQRKEDKKCANLETMYGLWYKWLC